MSWELSFWTGVDYYSMIKEKKKMITDDAANHLYKCGKVWREYVAGNKVVVVTDYEICPTDLFGDFYGVIKLGIDRGLVCLLTLDQVEAEHLNMCLVEF